jgi:hypothetical protein
MRPSGREWFRVRIVTSYETYYMIDKAVGDVCDAPAFESKDWQEYAGPFPSQAFAEEKVRTYCGYDLDIPAFGGKVLFK